MNKMTCEMCGGTDLIKQDGVFVCQSCGCQYSAEEAKKLMIEGTVDVKGTVKVDNSAFVEKSLANARRALGKEDWEEVEKYYNLVEQHVPDNIEAVFFSAFGKAMLSLTEDEYFKREQKFSVLTKSMSILNDCYETTTEDKEKTLKAISNAIAKMYKCTFLYEKGKVAGVGSEDWQIDLENSVRRAFLTELKQIQAVHKDEKYIQDLIAKNSEMKSAPFGCTAFLSTIGVLLYILYLIFG